MQTSLAGAPISWSSSLHPSESDNNGRDILFNSYQSQLSDQETINKVNNLFRAVMPIGEDSYQFSGNCVAIAKDLVLTSGHCIKGQVGFIGENVGKVVFDGSPERFDFKILQFKDQTFKPFKLDVVPNYGDAIQMYFKMNETSTMELYVRRFESGVENYATRSDIASSETKPGESGAPRMSMVNGCVYAIHQGESEGLKINDIHDVLEHVSKNDSDLQRRMNAALILQQATFENLEMKGMSWSPLTLSIGVVEEEKPRVRGSVEVAVKIEKKWKESTFGYVEVGEGKGPRAIQIHEEGVQGSLIQYNIEPNPHANNSYNEGGQSSFYRAIAKSVGEYYLQHNNTYSDQGTLKLIGENYKLSKSL